MSAGIIRILDDNTINKIAAGEVVERPASVVKELVENSIDAQSTSIEVEIIDGGLSFIRVTDNGVGMSAHDARTAILRHATSKIRSAEDLESIYSLGFRGEALPSIAAVSKFSLTTRLHNDNIAAYIEVHGGAVTDSREAGAGAGTTVTVAELFYNTPARRKFLKSSAAESGHIHDILGKLALSNPQIKFKLISNSRIVLSTPGTGKLLDTIASLYGIKAAEEVMPVNYKTDDIDVAGYIAKPTFVKSSRNWQTFIVNARVVSSRMLAKAVDTAYFSLIPKNGYPLAVLNFTVPGCTVDVNVHPQKSEIKFRDDKKVFKALHQAITITLNQPMAAFRPSVPLPAATIRSYFSETADGEKALKSLARSPVEYRPPVSESQAALWREDEGKIFVAAREMLEQTKSFLAGGSELLPEEGAEASGSKQPVPVPLGQVANCYIVARAEDSLYLIDQHAAHERILYEKLSADAERIPSQQLLTPLFFDLEGREIALVSEYEQVFYKLGFAVELAGPSTVRMLEMPADLPLSEAEPVLRSVLSAVEEAKEPTAAAIRHSFLQVASCRGAIKAGDALNMRQIQALVNELWLCKLAYTCPHGRPAVIRLNAADLAKMFKRT